MKVRTGPHEGDLPVNGGLGDDEGRAHGEMQSALLRSCFALMSVASLALVFRELVVGGPALSPILGAFAGVGAWIWSRHRTASLRLLGGILCFVVVLLIALGASVSGGAAAPALSFSFIPGLIAILVLGPRWGLLVTASMLCVFGWLGITTPLLTQFSRLRFQNEIAMTIFVAGLSYALRRSLVAYETSIAECKAALLLAGEGRLTLTHTIYEVLMPLSESLVETLKHPVQASVRSELEKILASIHAGLDDSTALAQRNSAPCLIPQDQDFQIRRRVMRIWLRIGIAFLTFVIVRNYLAGTSFVPSVFSLVFCVLIDLWLSRPGASKHAELVALVVGLLASFPLIAHIYEYGGTPDAPALVVTPSIVLFSALLSQGRVSWIIVGVQVAILAWVAMAGPMTLTQSRLLGNLALGCVVVMVVLHNILRLRRRYAETLRTRGMALLESQRRHRRLSGTLFHDVRNHLQALIFHLECPDESDPQGHAQSLGERVRALIVLSKGLLLEPHTEKALRLQRVLLTETVEALIEVYGPRMGKKGQHLSLGRGLELQVMALPEFLVDSVLGNLLSNAIKFSPEGATIDLQARSEGEKVRITLGDRGPGLSTEVIGQLGQEGAVPRTSGTNGEEGQGFGLQLVREHLYRMSGRLELAGRPGGGTDATVWLTADRSTDQ